MNGVEAALLQEILDQAKDQTDLLKRLAAASGGGGSSSGGGAAGGMNNLSSSSNAVTKSFNLLGAAVAKTTTALGAIAGVAIGLVSASFTSLVGITKTLASAQMNLAETAIAGTGSLSSLYTQLEALPGILGFAAKIFSYHTRVLEQNLATFQAMSDSGATLGGNLDEVRRSAKSMYLSMDEFANVMKSNTPYFLYFGQTANDGAKALIKFNSTMIQGSTGRALLGMGYSLEEANNMLGLYAATMGGVNSQQLRDQRSMESSVKSFATEMALSAELEGKSRKQKEEEMKERATIAARENMLSKMTAEQKQAFFQAEQAAGRAGGKAAQDALLSAMLGLPPMTKAAQTWTAMAGDSAKSITGMVPAIQSANAENANNQREISRLGAQAQRQVVDASQRFGRTLDVMSFRQGEVAETGQALQRAEATARTQNLRTTEDYLNRENKARQQLTDAQESQAGAVAQAAGAAKYQGEWLMNMLYNLFKPLEPVLIGIVKAFNTLAPPIIQFATDFVNEVLAPVFKDLFGDISLDDIIKPFKDFIAGFTGATEGLGFADIRKALFEFLNPVKEFLADIIKSIDFKAVGAFFGDVFKTLGQFARDIFTEMSTWDWKTIGDWIKWSLNAVGTFIKELFGGVKAALTGEVTEGGSFLKQAFEKIGILIRKIVIFVGGAVDKLINSPLFETVQKIFLSLVGLLNSLVDMLIAVVDSPLGSFVIDLFLNYWNFLAERILSLVNIVMGVVDIVTGIFQFMSGDFKGGWEKIKSGIASIITGLVEWFIAIPKFVLMQLATALGFIYKIVIGLITSLNDAFWYFVDQVGIFFSDGISGAVAKAWEALTQLWDTITSAIGDFGKQLWAKITGNEPEEPEEARPAPRPAPSPAQPRPPAPRETPRPPAREAAPAATPPTTGLGAAAEVAMASGRTLPPMTPAAAAYSGGANTDTVTLNTNLQQMIRNLREISDNTKRTADLIASNGNLFRR